MSEARNVQPPNEPAIPDKLYFRIGEVARLLNVETHTLRFWETEFPQIKVGKGGTGQRLYRRRDVELVLEIKHLLYEQGYTIPGARQFLQARQRRKDPAAEKAVTPAVEAVPAEPGAGGLQRIRAELRNLSDMLTDPPAAGRKAAEPTRPPHSVRSPALPNRGLHLASRPAKSRASRSAEESEVHSTLPGLFGPESD